IVFGMASDAIGSLVHDLEAHVLEDRDALGQRDRPVVAPHLQPDAAAWVAAATVKIDAEGAAWRQAFDDADVANGGDGRIVLLISLGESVAVTLEQGARPRRIVDARELVAECVDPGAHDRLDGALKVGAVRMRRLAG